jgi:hypothetical protein
LHRLIAGIKLPGRDYEGVFATFCDTAFDNRLGGDLSCGLHAQGCGYVEIDTVPVETTTPLYLNSVKLDPLKNGTAVLRHNVGTAKLAT